MPDVFSPAQREADAAYAFERTVAECMDRLGQRYEATAHPPVIVLEDPEDLYLLSPLALDSADPQVWLQHARSYGYGWVYDERRSVAADAFEPIADTNLAVQQSLSGPERRAYFTALYGERYPAGEPVSLDELFPPFDPDAGCWGEALAVHDPRVLLRRLPPEALTHLDGITGASSAVTAAWEQWSRCMSQRGFDGLGSRHDAVLAAEQLAGAGTGGARAEGGQGTSGLSAGWVEAEVQRGDEARTVALPLVDEAALAAERALATADAECDTEAQVAMTLRQARDAERSVFIATWRVELVSIGLLPAPHGG